MKKYDVLNLEESLFHELQDIMLKPEIKKQYIKFTNKKENPIIFYLRNGNQINPNFKEVALSVEFNNQGLNEYSYLLDMIPVKRTKSLFRKRSLGNIENINYEVKDQIFSASFNLSFLVETLNLEEIKDKLSEIIRYTNSFVTLHKEFIEQKKELEKDWKRYGETNEVLDTNTTMTDKVRLKTIPYDTGLVFLVTDYETPSNIILPQKHHMFPEGRMNSVFKKFFPDPCPYIDGRLLSSLPNSAKNHDFEEIKGRTKKTYQMMFNEHYSNTKRQLLVMSQAKNYISKFLELHYETLERTEQKSFGN